MQRHHFKGNCSASCSPQRFAKVPLTGHLPERCRRFQSISVVAVLGTKQTTGKADLSSSNRVDGHHHTVHHRTPLMVVTPLQPADLFPSNHVNEKDLFFYAYFPFGCAIAGVRMVMWLSLLFFDQAWLTNNDISIKVLQAILGVNVTWDNVEQLPQSRHVIVSNHITTGDMMALYRLPKRTVHLISSQLPDRIAKSRNHRIDFRHASVDSYDGLKGEKETSPIHLFPEGGMTNGVGMMKFNKGFMRFSDGLTVVPVALRAQLPWRISTHTLHSSFLSNLFWFCFSPYVSLTMTILPPLNREPEESKAAFVARIQQKIADELQIPILDFTLQAKKELMRTTKKEK